ncbi:MAG: hypothetical protein K0R67_2463 [Paenibacillus sp.]|nr:hypothetical protein [Paenibacillus sp.]
MLSLRRASPHHAEALHRIQKAAFQEDLDTYQDFETNPACETLDQMVHKIDKHDYFAIYFEEGLVGGVAVRQTADHEYRLSPIYLSPDFQNKGLGTQIFTSLFAVYQDARSWSLDTPKMNKRNGHFYEKLGFLPVGEHYINERLTLTRYHRVVE